MGGLDRRHEKNRGSGGEVGLSTKEEAFRRIDELERRIDGKIANLQRELELSRNREEYERKQHAGADAKVSDLERRLESYGDLAKALGKIRGDSVSPDLVRQIVREELPAVVGSNPIPAGGDLTLEKVETTVHVKKREREAAYSDDNYQGKILSVMLESRSDKKWKPSELADAVSEKWGLGDGSGSDLLDNVSKRLSVLVKEGVLSKIDDGNRLYT